jgi:hypothetical protein
MASIFEKIDSFDYSNELEINAEHDLFQTIEINGVTYNPFTYCIIHHQFGAFKHLINFIKQHYQHVQIGSYFLQSHLFGLSQTHFISLFEENNERKEFLYYFIENTSLNYFEKMNLLVIFLEHLEDNHTEKLIKQYLTKSYFEHKELVLLPDDIRDKFFNKYMPLNDDLYLHYFKDYMFHFEQYKSSLTLSNQDYLLDGFKEMVQKMDDVLFNTHHIDDLKAHFSQNGTLAQIKQDYQSILDEFSRVAQLKDANIFYLIEDNSFNKYLLYSNSIEEHGKDNYKNITHLIKDNFLNEYMKQHFHNPMFDEEKIKATLKQYHFKGINLSKYVDLDNVLTHIENSSELVKDIFKLNDSQVGGDNLYLNFTHLYSDYGGSASYTLGANMITHYAFKKEQNQSDVPYFMQLKSHFLHEYTHYLQDLTYHTYEFAKEHSKNQTELYNQNQFGEISENALFNEVLDNIYSYNASLDEVFNCSYKMIKYYFPFVKEEEFKLIFNQSFKQMDYTDIMSHSIHTWIDTIYSQYGNDFKEKMTHYMTETLGLIKKGYEDKSFSKTVWTEDDQKNNRIYLNHPFEIHARLVESMTELPIDTHPQPYFYPMTEAVQLIRPKLEKFNALLVENYKVFIGEKKKVDHLLHLKSKIDLNRKKESNYFNANKLDS